MDDVYEKPTRRQFWLWTSVIFVIILVFSILIINGIHIKTNNGKHTGYVTAIETRGLIFKTTTVYFKTDTESSQEDAYCLINDNLKDELQKAQQKKELVTISFNDYLVRGIKNCGILSIDNIIGVD